MSAWEFVVRFLGLPLAACAVTFLALLLRGWWRERKAAAVAGGDVGRVRVLVGRPPAAEPGMLQVATDAGQEVVAAFAYRDGPDLLVSGRGVRLSMAAGDYARSSTRRLLGTDSGAGDVGEARGFVDQRARRWFIAPVLEWTDALEALAARSESVALTQWKRWWLAAPRAAVVLGLVSAALTGAWLVAMSAIQDVTANVAVTPITGDAGQCDVVLTWQDLRSHWPAACADYSPGTLPAEAVPAIGYLDEPGGRWVGLGLLGGLTLLSLGWVWLGHRRNPPLSRLWPDLSAASADAAAAPVVERNDEGDPVDDGRPLLLLLDQVAAREAWAQDVTEAPIARTFWRDAVLAMRSVMWWPIAAVAAAALAIESLPRWASWALAGAAALWLARNVWIVVGILRTMSEPNDAPVTSSWDYAVCRDDAQEPYVLLLLGGAAHWLLPLDGVPPLTGRCDVRGELGTSGSVHLRIHGQWWRPLGLAERVDEEWLEALRLDLLDRLGRPTSW